MHNNCINKLLNLKEVKVKNIIHADSYVKIFIETKAVIQTCPCCKRKTTQIHDYRLQVIKDLPFQLKHCYLVLNKRRYRCSCGKRFSEKYDFIARYQQRSTRLSKYIANELIEKVRKRLQKSMPVSLRKYYKRSRKLILTRYNNLKDENKKACCYSTTMI